MVNPTPEYEIAYLRARIEKAERVIKAARALISPTNAELLRTREESMVYAIEGYADFLGNRPDPRPAPTGETR